ncbi:MAG: hypothetical protein WBF03_12600 [Xanthobacteraceae bacterium]
MTKNPAALEPSFADAIKAIAAATDPSEQIRRHWCSSLMGIAKAFDQPPELIPARYSAVRARMAALHHVPMNWTAKTVSNHRSNVKAALIWFRKEKDVLPHGVSLSPSWDRLRAQLTDPSTRFRLLPISGLPQSRQCAMPGAGLSLPFEIASRAPGRCPERKGNPLSVVEPARLSFQGDYRRPKN